MIRKSVSSAVQPTRYHRSAVRADKNRKGAMPAELPVEQLMKFKLKRPHHQARVPRYIGCARLSIECRQMLRR